MGTDIHGTVEIDEWGDRDDANSWWQVAGRVGSLVGRSYDSFSCLFGVRGYAGFDPIAADRGLPTDASRTTEEDAVGHSHTHVYGDELQSADWDELAGELDERYSVVDPNGDVRCKASNFGWMNDVFSEEELDQIEEGERVPIDPDEDAEVTLELINTSDVDDISELAVTRREMTRRDALSGAWEWFLFEHLPTLYDRYGAENVRLVVWFDS